VDAVIDEVLCGDLSMEQRQLQADEVAYRQFSALRQQAGDQLTPELSAQLNALVAIPKSEHGA
jgi:hypothetical protein